MAEQAPPQERAAGWMRDPSGRHFGRFWDGEQWTDHVISAETVPGIDPVEQRGDAPGPAPAGDRPGRWARDPYRRHASRYWDGGRWTEHVMSAARVPSTDPVPKRSVELTDAMSAPASLGVPRPPASHRRPAWMRTAPWVVAVIACGLVIIGIAISGDPPRPTQVQTNVTEPVATTAPSDATPLATTIPLGTRAPASVPGTPVDTGAPATAPATQPTVTRPATVQPPTTLASPGGLAADPSMSTTS
jgi:hypothetical protein